ncbi:MAG: DUF11 domain-containing protein, partial [Algoriphagus sp.]
MKNQPLLKLRFFTVLAVLFCLFSKGNLLAASPDEMVKTEFAGTYLDADLSLSQSASSLTPNAGSLVTFTLTVANNGSDLATNVQVENQLASGFTYQSDNSGGSYDVNSGQWTIGDLDAGDSKSIDIIVRIKGSGNFQNSASVTSDETDVNLTNNSQSITLVPVPQVDLQVNKTVNNANPAVGSEITFTIAVKNNGPSLANAVVVEDVLPNGFEFVSDQTAQGTYDENSGNWSIGNLSEGLTATLKITARVLEPTQGRSYENTAQISEVDEADTDASNDSDSQLITPVSTPSFSLTKTATESSYAQLGDEINYTLVVKNTGNVSISDVEVLDPKATSGPDFVSSDGNNDDVLDVGESWTFQASYEVTQEDIDAGSFTNQATATGTPVAGNLADATASESVMASLNPSWTIAKSSTITEFDAVGDEIEYEIILKNTGNVSIKDVQVTDPDASTGPTLTSGDDGNAILDVGETWT